MPKTRVYDSYGGAITVHTENVTGTREDTCTGNREAYKVRVVRNRKTVWKPKDPLCTFQRKPGKIIEEVVGFYEHAKAEGETLGGVKRKKRRRR